METFKNCMTTRECANAHTQQVSNCCPIDNKPVLQLRAKPPFFLIEKSQVVPKKSFFIRAGLLGIKWLGFDVVNTDDAQVLSTKAGVLSGLS